MSADRLTRRGLATVTTVTVLGLALWSTSPAGAAIPHSKRSAGNGYLLMVHATFEPHSHPLVDQTNTGETGPDQGKTGVLNGTGAVGATRDGDSIVIRAIPYLVATAYPVVVGQPRLQVDGPTGGRLVLEPNMDPEPDAICRFETHWAGHEGPVQACSGYRVPAGQFDEMSVVTLTLRFVDGNGAPQEEVHNLPAHVLLHAGIVGFPVDLKAIDEATTEPTPLVVEHLMDTSRSAHL